MQYFLLLSALLFHNCILQAQNITVSSDSTLRETAIRNTTDQYLQYMQRQAQLYSGREYVEFDFAIEGHQYLNSKLWEKANIEFGDLLYKQIDARYDLYRDLLIIKHFNEAGRMVSIVPDQEKIKYFNIYGNNYIRLASIDTLQEDPQIRGYYHVIYAGKYPILRKERKNLISSSTSDARKGFNEKYRYYLIKDNVIHHIRGKGSLWKLFPEYKKELKRYARRNRFYFAQEKGYYLSQVVKKYEMLTAN